jgi:glycosyltransferase involved in cell wall biosynthesis
MPGLPGADEIYATIKQLELSSSVVLTGRVPVENLPGLYACASLLVMPSVYEGFGFPILEAMAAGTPVITSDSSSLPEVAGDAAILFPPQDHYALADAIEELIQNPMATEELRRKGLARSLQFNWQRTAAETMAVYRAAAT